jgi:HTH-type transcriptional regulator / antitoxin HigA
VEDLWDSPERSVEATELDVLTTLIEAYERAHCPVDLPNPIEAIKFRLEQQGKDSKSLIVVGQRTRVYKVMQGKRPLSLNMIRNLQEKLGIPADVLIQPSRRPHRITAKRSPAQTVRGRLRTSTQAPTAETTSEAVPIPISSPSASAPNFHPWR